MHLISLFLKKLISRCWENFKLFIFSIQLYSFKLFSFSFFVSFDTRSILGWNFTFRGSSIWGTASVDSESPLKMLFYARKLDKRSTKSFSFGSILKVESWSSCSDESVPDSESKVASHPEPVIFPVFPGLWTYSVYHWADNAFPEADQRCLSSTLL